MHTIFENGYYQMISIQNLSVEFSSKSLFDNVTFVINKRDRIALVGRNGAGKSTMLKIIAGLQSPTSGSVSKPNDITIGYLPQQMLLADTKSLKDEVSEAFSHIKEVDRKIESLNAEISNRTDYESEEYQNLLERLSHYTELQIMYQSDNGEAEMERTLVGLGFKRSDFERHTSEFSGGWRMRIELAKLLLLKPDVLLLDEPTNHLDIESIQWLENFIKTKGNTVVLVSHDKAFIDNVTNRTIEISLGKIYDYAVNYSKFLDLRKERIEQQMRAYQNQQKMIQDTEAFIERFRYKPTKSVQVQSRIKQLSKIERIEVDQVDNSRINLKFPPAPRSGDYPIIAEDVEKYYGDHKVFDSVTFTLRRGEKVAFVGKNGEGKSTLVKCIMNEIQYGGMLKLGHNVKIGYFAQNQAQLLDQNITVFDTIDRVAVGDIRTRINDILGAFRFGGEASEKFVKVLSGGEKSRLAMIKLLLEPANLLILDEPTNHLDIPTKEVLKQAIREYDGTAIIVSHDRDFLDGLVSKVYEFGNGKVKEHLGGIYDFLQSKNLESLRDIELPTATSNNSANARMTTLTSANGHEKAISGSKRSYFEQKEHDKIVRQARKRVSELEAMIEKFESEIKSIEDVLANGATDASTDIYQKHAEVQKKLENTMSEWEIASEELEKLECD